MAEEGISNFFSEFGLCIHEILEKYFLGEITKKDLPKYYIDHYNDFVKSSPPSFRMIENYYNDGLSFFTNFDYNKDDYNIIFTEEKIIDTYNGINLTVKPDLLVQEKFSNKYILVDYKTAKLRSKTGTGKYDTDKIKKYKLQLLLYAYFIWTVKQIEVKEIWIFFIRNNFTLKIPVVIDEVLETTEWFTSMIQKLKNDEEYKPNTSKDNKFFCENICGLREICEYRNVITT
jgi:hypothetical protein